MSEIRTDCRRREIDTDPDEVREFEASMERYLELQREVAKALVRLGARGVHLGLAYGSLRDYVRHRFGVSCAEIAMLVDLGRALGVSASHVRADDAASLEADEAPSCTAPAPSVEDRVASHAMSTENATTLGRLLRQADGLTHGDHGHWTRLAERTTPWKFRQLVRKHIEETTQREVTVPMAFQVTERARDDFWRARELASRRAGRWLTEGQTFALVVRRFVDAQDERLVGEKPRQVPDTRGVPMNRYVPAAVRRAVRKRAEDRCEVPGCSNGSFVELMHVDVAHRDGGSREVDNLALGCTSHHFLLDAGVIRFGGWRDERPVFLDRLGRELDGGATRHRGSAVEPRTGALGHIGVGRPGVEQTDRMSAFAGSGDGADSSATARDRLEADDGRGEPRRSQSSSWRASADDRSGSEVGQVAERPPSWRRPCSTRRRLRLPSGRTETLVTRLGCTRAGQEPDP